MAQPLRARYPQHKCQTRPRTRGLLARPHRRQCHTFCARDEHGHATPLLFGLLLTQQVRRFPQKLGIEASMIFESRRSRSVWLNNHRCEAWAVPHDSTTFTAFQPVAAPASLAPPSPLPVPGWSLKMATPFSKSVWGTLARAHGLRHGGAQAHGLRQERALPLAPQIFDSLQGHGFCGDAVGQAEAPEANRPRLGRHRCCVAFEAPPTHSGQHLCGGWPRRNCGGPADACSSRNPVQACSAVSSAESAAGNGFLARSAVRTQVLPSLQTKARLEGKSS